MIKVRTHKNNNWLKDAGYSFKEEQDIYDAQLQDVMDNTRWYLDNEKFLPTYKVSWVGYTKTKITLPYRHVLVTKRRRLV